MNPVLFVAPQAGLCNRMRVMLGAIALAKEAHAHLVFFWERNDDLNAPFHTLFENFPYKVIEFQSGSSWQSRLYKVLGKLCKVVGDDYVREHCKFPQGGISSDLNWLFGNPKKLWFLLTCEQFYPASDYSIFKVHKSLVERASKLNPCNTVGIHIRRTDNLSSIKYSPTSLFITEMENIVKDNPETVFFLSTDDSIEEEVLRDHFGEIIVSYKKRTLARDKQEGIEDAVIDLYSLAHCRLILGSYFSSFSDVAAMWGGIEKQIVKQEI